MFREGVSGDGGPHPESKRPPDDLDSWKEVLEKVGVSAALSTAFKNVYSAGVNAASAKYFQQTIRLVKCCSWLCVCSSSLPFTIKFSRSVELCRKIYYDSPD
jgi:hypothetical protein